jgi:flagellar hook protein FlgE
MGITGALYSGVSGLKANGNAMSVIGNNLANSNTVGFKASRTVFGDLLSTAVSSTSGSSQIGRGTSLSVVDNIFSQGTFQNTESNTDLAIEGPGFFIVRGADDTVNSYTRAGSFRFNDDGYMVNAEDYRVQGYRINDAGETGNSPEDVVIDVRSRSAPQATTEVTVTTNLNANGAIFSDKASLTSAVNLDQADTAANIYAGNTETFGINGINITVGDYGDAYNIGSAKELAEDIEANEDLNFLSVSLGTNERNVGGINIPAAGLVLATGNLVINGYDVADENEVNDDSDGDGIDDRILIRNESEFLSFVNNICGLTNVEAYFNVDNEFVFKTTDGSNIQLESTAAADDGAGAAIPAGFFDDPDVATAFDLLGASAETSFGPITIESSEDLDLIITDTGGAKANTLLGVDFSSVLTSDYAADLDSDTLLEEYSYPATGFDIENPGDTSNFASSLRVFDAEGFTHLVTTYFRKTDNNEWEYHVTVPRDDLKCANCEGDTAEVKSGLLKFSSEGALLTVDGVSLYDENGALKADRPTVNTPTLNWSNGAEPSVLTYDFIMTQYATESEVVSQEQDGFGTGTLVDLAVDNEGYVVGSYSNGEPQRLFRIALGKFPNVNGLSKLGTNLFGQTDASGPPSIGTPGSGVGTIFTNSLEQSNVDIAEEFTRMITTQRGYQANSRVITTTDEMLNEVINMKR